MVFRVSDTEIRDPRVDRSTRSIIVIDYPHHELHDGKNYSIYYQATGKNDGDKINVYFKTPDTEVELHLLGRWSATGAAFGRLLEGPTVTANTGTNDNDIYNHNRNSSNTSGVLDNATTPNEGKYGYDVTVTVNGTILVEEYSGAAKTIAGEGRSEAEYILKPNTAYVFEVESDAASLNLSLGLHWYEHAPKD